MAGFYGSGWYGSGWYASEWFRGTGVVPTPAAPAGPGRPCYVFDSPKRKKRKRFQNALLAADLDFVKAEKYVTEK